MRTDFKKDFSRYRLIFPLVFMVLAGPAGHLAAQCLRPELVMLNSCIEHPNPNGSGLLVESEILILRSGVTEVSVSTIGVDLPFNGFGQNNSDLGVNDGGTFLGCDFKEPTITSLSGCPGAIPIGPGGIIPPEAFVVIFVNGLTETADAANTDFTNICSAGRPVVILQSDCERTAGAFANAPGAGDPRRFTTVFSPCGPHLFSYNNETVSQEDGTYYLVGPNESGNLDCAFPVLPETCPKIDTTYNICGAGAAVNPPLDVTLFEQVYPPSVLSVTFYRTAVEAELNLNRLTEYGGPTDSPDTLFSRVFYAQNSCFVVSRLFIRFSLSGAATTAPTNLLRGCDEDEDGTGNYNLTQLNAEIGSGDPVTYFTDAAGTDPVISPEDYEGPAGTIFAAAGLGNCMGDIVSVMLELVPGPDAVSTIDDTSCPGNPDGRITISAIGDGPFDYDWASDEFDGGNVADGLAPGQYRITVTDRFGCEDRRRPRVRNGDVVEVSCSVTRNASDMASANGAVRLDFAEGRPPFTVNFLGASAGSEVVNTTSFQLENLVAGEYFFTVTDSSGCVSETCSLELPFSESLEVVCEARNGSNETTVFGGIRVIVSGGTAPFLINVRNTTSGASTNYPDRGNGEHVFTNLPVGNYLVSVLDANGIVRSCASDVLFNPCPLTVFEVSLLANDCTGSDNTIIRITVAGNEGNISTVWSGGNDIEDYNGLQEAGPLPPGEYFVTITDEGGCPPVTEGPIVVTNPGTIDYSITGMTDVSPCRNDGSLRVVVEGGGQGPYTVVLFNVANATELDDVAGQVVGDIVVFDGLSAGPGAPTYAVFVRDATGCESDQTFLPFTGGGAPDLMLVPADQAITSPACNGDSTGRALITASGGQAPYEYRWIDYPQLATGRILPDGDTQTDLPAGVYQIEITDDIGCVDTLSVVVPAGDVPTIICGPTTMETETTPGAVVLTPGGGTAPYVIELTSVVGDGNYPVSQAGDTTITGLPAGEYAARVTDVNGCSSASCLFVVDGSPLTCDLRAAIMLDTAGCPPADPWGIALVVTGGTEPYVFDWTADSLPDLYTVEVFGNGTYSVAITDANNCRLDTMVVVEVTRMLPVFQFGDVDTVRVCQGQDFRLPVTLSGTGPFGVTNTILVNGTSVNSLTEDFSGTQDTLIIPASRLPVDTSELLITTVRDQNCRAEGQLFLTLVILRPDTVRRFDVTCSTDDILIGGHVFNPMMPSDTFLNAGEGGCGVRYEVAIDFAPGSMPDTVQRFDITCRTSGLNIGGRTFTPAFPSDTFLVVQDGTCGIVYQVDLSFQNGSMPDTVLVEACPAVPYVLNGEVFDANRPEGPVSFPRTGGQCDSVVWIRLDILPEFLGNYGENVCAGDTVIYGGRSFTADEPGGLVRLPGLASTGCDSLVVVNNNFRRTGELRLFGDFNICPGDSIELRFSYDGPGGINARLRDAQGNVTPLENMQQGSRVVVFPAVSTSYRLLDAEIGGCSGTVAGSSTVVVNDLEASAEVLLDPGNFCRDTLGTSSVSFTGGVGPFDISWSNGPTDTVNRNLPPGTYTVVVTDALGCVVSDSVKINPRLPLNVELTGIAPDCPTGRGSFTVDTIFGGTGFYEISLDGEFFVPIEDATNLDVAIGSNRAFIQDAGDCSARVTFFVPPPENVLFNLPSDTTILQGDSVLLDPGSVPNLDSAWWSPPATLRTPDQLTTIAVPLRTSRYTVFLRTEGGCLFTQDIEVIVDRRLPVYLPTAFSPNGDEINDTFRPRLGPTVRSIRSFKIFNRWGDLVHDQVEGWDGMHNGRRAEPAVYVFRAVVEMADGVEREIRGDFVLMR